MKYNTNSKKIITALKNKFPDAKCSLDYNNIFQLLIATILSAQTTDKKVNKVTKELFTHFPSAYKLANAPPNRIEKIIYPLGLYKNKSYNIIKTAKLLTSKEVPDTLDDLMKLPGVGRKTANVVLGNGFNKPCGIVVDTHVKRISYRLGLTKSKDPLKIESDLISIFNKKDWIMLPHYLINLGRTICIRNPKCTICPLTNICPKKEQSKKA